MVRGNGKGKRGFELIQRRFVIRVPPLSPVSPSFRFRPSSADEESIDSLPAVWQHQGMTYICACYDWEGEVMNALTGTIAAPCNL